MQVIVEQANCLAESNIGLVYRFIQQNIHRGEHWDDLESLCMEHFVRASRDFDPARGKFSTFAWRYMMTALANMRRGKVSHSGTARSRTYRIGEFGEDSIRIQDIPVHQDPSARLETEELVGRMLGKLRSRDRYVIEQIFLLEKPVKELAAHLRYTEAYVYMLRNRAIKQLRAMRLGGGNIIRSVLPPPRRSARPWTLYEDEFVGKHTPGWTAIRIASALDRSKSAIDQRRSTLGCHVKRLWQRGDIRYVRDNYGKLRTREIALALGRSPSSVGIVAQQLGVSCGHKRVENHIGAINGMIRAAHNDQEIADATGLCKSSIYKFRKRHGIARIGWNTQSTMRWRKTMESRYGVSDTSHARRIGQSERCAARGWPQARSNGEVRVLDILRNKPKTRLELAAALGTVHPNERGHCNIHALYTLSLRGLIEKHRVGKCWHYGLSPLAQYVPRTASE